MIEFKQFKQFEQESGKPIDASDIPDDGKAELTRIREYLGKIFAQDNYKKVEEEITKEQRTVETGNIVQTEATATTETTEQ